MEHFQKTSGLTKRQIKLIAIEVSDLEVSIYDTNFLNFLSNRVIDLLHSTGLDLCYVSRKCHYLIFNKKIN